MLTNLVIWIIFGIAVGWVANELMKGYSPGLATNLILGVVGSIVGGWLFGVLNINVGGTLGNFVAAVIGAMLVLFLVGMFHRRGGNFGRAR